MPFDIFPNFYNQCELFYKENKVFLKKISNSRYFWNSNSITKIRNQEIQSSLIIVLIQSQATPEKISNPDACFSLSDSTHPLVSQKPISFQTLAGHEAEGVSGFKARRQPAYLIVCDMRTGDSMYSQSSSSPKSVAIYQEPKAPVNEHVNVWFLCR